MPLKAHQQAWLDAHPERTERWLRDRFADGFDIHHVDGNDDNNDTENLVLIEHCDHFQLHGRPPIKAGQRRRGVTKKRLAIGKEAYRLAKAGYGWRTAGKYIGCTCSTAQSAAKVWSEREGLAWPIQQSAR